MTGFLVTLASSDPLDHVLDHDLLWFTDNLQITRHVLFLALAAALCLIVFPMVAKRLAGGYGLVGPSCCFNRLF